MGKVAMIVLGIAFASPAHAGAYVGFDLAGARFNAARGSADAMTTVLQHERFDLARRDQFTDVGLFPVLGYQFNRYLGVEATYRSFRWESRIDARVGATTLHNVTTGGPATPITSAEFNSHAWTTYRAFSIGPTLTLGRVYAKLAYVKMDTCSRVTEASDAIGRTPEHAESRSGLCVSDSRVPKDRRRYSKTLGYLFPLSRQLTATAFVEATPRIGNEGTAFVDGGGVRNQTLVTVGAGLRWNF